MEEEGEGAGLLAEKRAHTGSYVLKVLRAEGVGEVLGKDLNSHQLFQVPFIVVASTDWSASGQGH